MAVIVEGHPVPEREHESHVCRAHMLWHAHCLNSSGVGGTTDPEAIAIRKLTGSVCVIHFHSSPFKRCSDCQHDASQARSLCDYVQMRRWQQQPHRIGMGRGAVARTAALCIDVIVSFLCDGKAEAVKLVS